MHMLLQLVVDHISFVSRNDKAAYYDCNLTSLSENVPKRTHVENDDEPQDRTSLGKCPVEVTVYRIR